MEENFNPIAQTRANYYTPGSPVQFVRVELLRGEKSGDNAVCLTFKNISQVTVTALDISFNCKDEKGELLCNGKFSYADIEVKPGELFGMDEAVFVTQSPIAKVDVVIKRVYNRQRLVRLEGVKRVRLPAPHRLPAQIQSELESRMSRRGLRYAPEIVPEKGWYCACGAFHPNEENTVYCTECGSDRILLQNALNNLLRPETAEPAPPESDGTKTMSAVEKTLATGQEAEEDGTRKFEPETAAVSTAKKAEETREAPVLGGVKPEDDAKKPQPEESNAQKDGVAENLIRWIPPLTALICAGIALSGYVYCQLILAL